MIGNRFQISKIFAILLVVFTSAFVSADIINKNPLSIEFVRTSKPEIEVQDNMEVKIHVSMAEKHHAYTKQFQIIKNEIDWLKTSKPKVDNEVEFDDPVTKTKKKGIGEGASVLTFVVEPTPESPDGSQKLNLLLEYQACTKKYCLLPIRLPFEVEFTVIGGVKAAKSEISIESLNTSKGIQNLLNEHLALTFLLVFLAGILTSFTPCIFPMIPITLAVLGTRDEKRSKTAGLGLSLSYVLGIALTYSILGVIAAMTGALFGGFLGHPLVAGALGIVFVVLGLSMYGLFEIQVPQSVSSKLSLHKTQGGPIGAFMAGNVAGILASPCVGPVLVGLLTFVAQTGNVTLGFALMFTFAFGMGQLFLVLGTFTQLLNKLPRSGSWMDFVKFFMGTTMIGLALFYVQPIVSEPIFDMFSGLAVVLISSYFGAFASQSTPLHQMKKGALLAFFFLGTLLIARGVAPGFFERAPHVNGTGNTSSEQVEWKPFTFTELESAKKSGKGIVIDFYADWCLACKEMEVDTFPKPEVQAVKENFIWLKFDATQTSDDFEKLRAEHSILGLPWILIYDAKGAKRDDLTLTGFEGPKEFSNRLKKAISAN